MAHSIQLTHNTRPPPPHNPNPPLPPHPPSRSRRTTKHHPPRPPGNKHQHHTMGPRNKLLYPLLVRLPNRPIPAICLPAKHNPPLHRHIRILVLLHPLVHLPLGSLGTRTRHRTNRRNDDPHRIPLGTPPPTRKLPLWTNLHGNGHNRRHIPPHQKRIRVTP